MSETLEHYGIEMHETVHQLTALRDRLGARPEVTELLGASPPSGASRLRAAISAL